MRLSAICAMGKNRVIGNKNQLPWHLPADLRHFKSITTGKPIILGRKTYESIGRALPDRLNVVITRDVHFKAPGCIVVNSIETALSAVSFSDDVFVIGGAVLYQQLLAKIERLYLTIIDENFVGDAFFPELNMSEWIEIERENCSADEQNKFDFCFVVYQRK